MMPATEMESPSRTNSNTPTVEMEKYLTVSNKLEIDDIDWEAGRRVGLTEDEVFTLNYFSDIEYQTINYMRDLLSTDAGKETEVIAFLTIWNYEEFFHGHALEKLLGVCGHPPQKNRIAEIRKNRTLRESLESFAAVILSKIFYKEFPAVHATWGAVQEFTALQGYDQLAKKTNNPVLKTLCERIAKQERRHFAWYFNSAKMRLQKSTRSQRVTRWLLSRFWTPNGAGVKTPTEVNRLMNLLFGGPNALTYANDVDSKIGTLPGMSGVSLMRAYMRKNLAV